MLFCVIFLLQFIIYVLFLIKEDNHMKSLDLTKFYASNFYEHFFELVKKYDGIFSTNYYAEATTWIANYNFDAIYNFLENTIPNHFALPFTFNEFIDMTNIELAAYQHICSKNLQEFIIERENLYSEIDSFYN